MSTRCRIGHVEKDGKVRSIYCHHDGYLSYVGKKLSDFYDENNIEQLLDLGDLSALGNNPVSNKEAWEDFFGSMTEEKCISYRDRGEDDVDARIDPSVRDFWKSMGDCSEEYMYLLNNGKWFYCEHRNDIRPLE